MHSQNWGYTAVLQQTLFTATVNCSKKYSARLWLRLYLVQHCLVHSCRKNGLKKHCYATIVRVATMVHNRSDLTAKKQEKRRKTRLYGLLYVALMWKSTPLHANRNEKINFRLHRTIVFFRERAKNISVHVSVVSEDQCLAQGHFVHTAFRKPTAFTVKRGVCHYQHPPLFFLSRKVVHGHLTEKQPLGCELSHVVNDAGVVSLLTLQSEFTQRDKKTEKQWHHTPRRCTALHCCVTVEWVVLFKTVLHSLVSTVQKDYIHWDSV